MLNNINYVIRGFLPFEKVDLSRFTLYICLGPPVLLIFSKLLTLVQSTFVRAFFVFFYLPWSLNYLKLE